MFCNLSNVYPGATRNLAGILFEIKDAEIEYFYLFVNPIFRGSYKITSPRQYTAVQVSGFHIR